MGEIVNALFFLLLRLLRPRRRRRRLLSRLRELLISSNHPRRHERLFVDDVYPREQIVFLRSEISGASVHQAGNG